MSTLAIVNPVAGNGAASRVWDRLRSRVEVARTWECATTEQLGHARELAQTAASHGYQRVIAIGGDGTISEAANGLACSETALGIIPAGTGNDISRNLGIPRDPAVAGLLAATGTPRSLDLCEVQTRERTRLVMGIAGFGFDAEVAERVDRLPKLGGGTLPYLIGVLQTLWQYRSPHMRITVDGHVVDQRVFLVAVGNLPTYGGGMRILPRAEPDDGLVDVCVVKDLNRLDVLRILPRIYSGGHVSHPAVELLRGTSVSADAHDRVLCHADGELVGALPTRFAIRPGVLRCVTGPATPASTS